MMIGCFTVFYSENKDKWLYFLKLVFDFMAEFTLGAQIMSGQNSCNAAKIDLEYPLHVNPSTIGILMEPLYLAWSEN